MKVKDFGYINQNPKMHPTLAVSEVVGVRHDETKVAIPALVCHERSDRRFHYMVLGAVDNAKGRILSRFFYELEDNAGQQYAWSGGHSFFALCHFARPNEYPRYDRVNETATVYPQWHTMRLVASMALAQNGFSFTKQPVQCVKTRLKGLLYAMNNDFFLKEKKESFTATAPDTG